MKNRYDCKEKIQRELAFSVFNKLLANQSIIELKEIKPTRTNAQNAALHLYFTYVSNELINLGLTFNYEGIKGMNIELPYTVEIVKNFVWRPIQIALFDIKSTTKINTKQINTILDILNKFFGERGILIEFPNLQSLMIKLDSSYLERL